MSYWLAIKVSVSRLINALLCGYSGEMFSARAYRLRNCSLFWGVTKEILDSVWAVQPRHEVFGGDPAQRKCKDRRRGAQC
jgi:hypothetical protein